MRWKTPAPAGRLGIAILGLAAGAILASCGPAPETPHGVRATGAGQPVAVATIKASVEGGGVVEVPGTVEATRVAGLASRAAATIERIAVEEGSGVRRGDLLVRLDGRELLARVEAAEAQLEAARAQRDRIRSLFEKDSATRREMEAADAGAAAAAAEVKVARAQLDYVDLRAPFDGRVTARRMQAGDLALPGHEILSIEGAGPMRVSATVPQEQAESLALGAPLEAILERDVASACVTSVLGPAGDPSSRRFLVKCDLPAGIAAHAGSFARLRLPAPSADRPITVPAEAIFERGGLTGLFVVEEGRARLRWISAGASERGRIAVRAGLLSGEEVILRPVGLTDGASVRPEPAGPEAAR